eukprot:PRCOL_00006587-RA
MLGAVVARGRLFAAPRRAPPPAARRQRAHAAAAAVAPGERGGGGEEKQQQKQRERAPLPKKNAEINLTCDSLAYGGLGVCRTDEGVVVFCERALPGERLVARVSKRRRGYLEAFKLQTLSPHADAAEARCEHFGTCGGCKLQNLDYDAQLRHKRAQVVDLMQRVGRWERAAAETLVHEPTVGAASEYGYRNKMEFSLSTRQWTAAKPTKRVKAAKDKAEDVAGSDGASGGGVEGDGETGSIHAGGAAGAEEEQRPFFMGLHAPGRFDKVVPIRRCEIQSEPGNAVLKLVAARAQELGLQAYDPVDHTGFLRHLMVRSGKDPADPSRAGVMVNIITATDERHAELDVLARELVETVPEVCTVVHNVTPPRGGGRGGGGAQPSVGERTLEGAGYIVEELRGLRFRISANSFFQTNTEQAERLYELAAEAADLRPDETLLDLFCGTGTIGLSMARGAKEVHGFELSASAVEDANKNAADNGITNATFHLGDLGSAMKDLDNALPNPDVVITDPNRPGMSGKLLRWLRRCGARRIVYVSCNPSTMARDLQVLCAPPVRPGEGDTPPEAGADQSNAEAAEASAKKKKHGAYRSSKPQFQYDLEGITVLDLFPHSHHAECVATLTLAP